MSGQTQPLTELKVTDHIVNLKRGTSRSISSAYVQTMRKHGAAMEGGVRVTNGSVPLLAVEAGQVFLAPITVGNQEFDVVVDTGSSDPWLATTNYVCADPVSAQIIPAEDCYFGPPYDPSLSSSYSDVPNESFNITYADGELLNGDMSYESFTLAGITVPQQKFGIVDYAAWYGDGYSSGLLGFAYGTLTSAYAGDDPAEAQRGGTLPYTPLFVNMYNQSLVAPMFSLAIDRDPNNGGVLALGGIPDIPHSPYWVSTPTQSVGLFIGTNIPAYEFYTIEVDGYAFSASPSTQFNVYDNINPRKTNLVAEGTTIIDSGTSLVYAPNAVADGVAAAFNPPAEYNEEYDAYFVDCNAQAPVFGISIGKKIFYVNEADLIVPASNTLCITGVQRKNNGLAILGDVWMKNVISVFDLGAAQMRFAARQYYGMQRTPKAATT
ncbi:hypothetical protein LTR37_013142 [Vermiconidia calcicola]|uniref:Uncharacterized protein n=1 Tax=Vermiconidia calcicola TaxID=1690605 RepID=A0ACC3MX96_9PEZI|nr:hypothetical protein LTR37_013142 [Vermiconidia calcicola]